MRALKMVLPVVAAALLVAPALAQFGPRGGMRGGAGMLLGNPGVQKELKLTDDQLKKVEEQVRKNGEKAREAFQSGDREKAQEVFKEIATETDKFIKDTLNADQQKRLKQIQRQQAGPGAFTDEETAKELKLNGEQKDDIKKVNADLQSQTQELFQGIDRQDREKMQEAFKKSQGMRKEALEKITKMLTPDQKKAWKELTGEPFEVQFGPGGRGGFGKGKKQE
jgi:hypothetical protein